MLLVDEKHGFVAYRKHAFDFSFPPSNDYLIRYASDNGNILYFQKRRFRKDTENLDESNIMKVYLDSNGAVKVEDVEDVMSLASDIQKKLRYPTEWSSAMRSHLNEDCPKLYPFEEFDRIRKFEIYLAYLKYGRTFKWTSCKTKRISDLSPSDMVADFIGGEVLMWGLLKCHRYSSESSPSWLGFSNMHYVTTETLFIPDVFYFYDISTTTFSYLTFPNRRLEIIRSYLKISYDEPIFYQTAQFHENSSKNVYFIGTFRENTLLRCSFTTVLVLDMEFYTISIKASFGENGKIYGFRVHVDSPPIVDHSSNYAVVLSFEKPEVLVICLETFAHIRVDLRNWTTMGFINRWDTVKRRICMSFLSNYSRLMFFPRYTKDDDAKKTPTDAKVVLFSTMVNWKKIKETVIMPFLKAKRNQ